MKKIAFILGLVALFAVSCNSNNSSTKKGSDLEELLVQFQTEDPQEIDKTKTPSSSWTEDIVTGDCNGFGYTPFLGSIGHIDSTTYFNFFPNASRLTISRDCLPGLEEGNKSVTTISTYNIETGYLVLAVRNNGELIYVIKGHLYNEDYGTFKGVIYGKETKLPFNFTYCGGF